MYKSLPQTPSPLKPALARLLNSISSAPQHTTPNNKSLYAALINNGEDSPSSLLNISPHDHHGLLGNNLIDSEDGGIYGSDSSNKLESILNVEDMGTIQLKSLEPDQREHILHLLCTAKHLGVKRLENGSVIVTFSSAQNQSPLKYNKNAQRKPQKSGPRTLEWVLRFMDEIYHGRHLVRFFFSLSQHKQTSALC